ncbi:MAG: fibronectin type III domain-containing protein [Pyrinomonadaceae bacterium]
MDYRKLSDADLASFSKNVEDQLIAHSVTGLDNALADDLAAPLTTLNPPFGTAIDKAVEDTAVKQSTVADKQAIRDDVIVRLATVRNYMIAASSPKKAFELCGFTYPAAGATVIANDPTDLVGVGSSNGVNRISFSGNNRHGRVVYEVWRRHGDTADWGIIASIRRQYYIDTPVTPGQYYEYKVRAVAATNTSNFSNSAVVYGAV